MQVENANYQQVATEKSVWGWHLPLMEGHQRLNWPLNAILVYLIRWPDDNDITLSSLCVCVCGGGLEQVCAHRT